MLVNGALGISRRVRDVVESRWNEALFGEHIFRGVKQQRPRVFQAPLPRPALHHGPESATESVIPIGYLDTHWYLGVTGVCAVGTGGVS